jgi:hypothetical protein
VLAGSPDADLLEAASHDPDPQVRRLAMRVVAARGPARRHQRQRRTDRRDPADGRVMGHVVERTTRRSSGSRRSER